MTTVQHFNSLPNSVIQMLIAEYKSQGRYSTSTMNKAGVGSIIHWLHPILEKVVGKSLAFCSGNFYKHTIPYLPHTDYKSYQDNSLNLVIPLEYTGQQAYLIIFDQIWNQDSITWCMHHPVQYFETNIGVKGCPWEYPVVGLTNTEIDDNLHSSFLSHYSKNNLQGLSGVAYPFEVGSVIEFDNKKIHCTSNFKGEKLGLSLRFKEL